MAIEIESSRADAFALAGDSGSLIYVPNGQPMGLLCASSAAGGSNGLDLVCANPIDAVVAALGVTLVC